MGLIIEDGTGSGNTAKVTSEHRILTQSVSEGPLEDASAEGGAAFFYSSYAASSNEEVISIKNTESTEILHITRLLFTASGSTLYTIFKVTSGTAAGTTLTYQNPNLNSGIEKSVVAFGNASVTGSLTGNTLFTVGVSGANTQASAFLEGALQLSNNDEIAITISAGVTVYVTVIGFWHKD